MGATHSHDPGRRGGQLGRPHRLCLSRPRRRGASRHRHVRPGPQLSSSGVARLVARSSRFIRGVAEANSDRRSWNGRATCGALSALRAFNYENIYLRPASREQSAAGHRCAARPRRVLCGPSEPHSRGPTHRRRCGRHSRCPPCSDHLCGRHDRPVRGPDRRRATGWDTDALARFA